jgi:hypothetical protein
LSPRWCINRCSSSQPYTRTHVAQAARPCPFPASTTRLSTSTTSTSNNNGPKACAPTLLDANNRTTEAISSNTTQPALAHPYFTSSFCLSKSSPNEAAWCWAATMNALCSARLPAIPLQPIRVSPCRGIRRTGQWAVGSGQWGDYLHQRRLLLRRLRFGVAGPTLRGAAFGAWP